MKKEDEIRIVESATDEKRARFNIEVELVKDGIRSLKGHHLFNTTCLIGESYPIIARAVEALKAAQKPKFEVGKWIQGFSNIIKITAVHDHSFDAEYCNFEGRHTKTHFSAKTAYDPTPLDPPSPNFMTAEELERRFRPTGNLLEDTKLALELSIEKWERNRVWVELLGPKCGYPAGDNTCALCLLFIGEEKVCPLRRRGNLCRGGCCDEWYKIGVAGSNEKLDNMRLLIDLMKTRLAEVNEKLKAPETIGQHGHTYKRMDKK